MRAVWSFWSKPFRANKGWIWCEPRHHLLAWGLSLTLARRHFPETQLVTDTRGKAMIVDELGLEFDQVSTGLDCLAGTDPGWWALGKLVAYSLQDRPFVHLDADVFLWKALPASLTSSPVFTQCPEQHLFENEWWCGPRDIERLFDRHNLSLPVEWQWASSRNSRSFRQDNCGILGGNRVDFIRHYAQTALRMVSDPTNGAAWAQAPDKSGFNVIIEQFLLAACVDYHRINPRSVYRGVAMRYLFSSWSEAHDPHAAARAGYTHLLGGHAKASKEVMARLERRVEQLDPELALRCLRVAQSPVAMEA
jgi:hypothetical protein